MKNDIDFYLMNESFAKGLLQTYLKNRIQFDAPLLDEKIFHDPFKSCYYLILSPRVRLIFLYDEAAWRVRYASFQRLSQDISPWSSTSSMKWTNFDDGSHYILHEEDLISFLNKFQGQLAQLSKPIKI